MAHDDHADAQTATKWLGLALGPLAAGLVYLLFAGHLTGGPNLAGVSDAACACAAVATLMAIWWLTQAIPLPITSLLPLALFPVLGVATMPEASAPYGDPIVFLFLGGFLIQLAMERWNLHRRIALLILLAVGDGPARLVGGCMLATAFISMWVSNAAAAAMMLPIGMSLAQRIALGRSASPRPTPPVTAADPQHGVLELPATASPESTNPAKHPDPSVRHFAAACMIGIAWAATIGGLATPIGTAPNVQLVAYLDREGFAKVTFAQWLWFGAPLAAAFLIAAWVLLTKVFFTMRMPPNPDAGRLVREDYRALGPMKFGEWATLGVFLFAVTGWLFQTPIATALGLVRVLPNGATQSLVTDAGVAITAGLLLFLIPVSPRRGVFVLDWAHASRLPYGVLILFGGGLSLAAAITATGLDKAIAQPIQGLAGVHLLMMILAITAAAVFLSELVSNTALTATLLPIVGAAALGLGVPPALVLFPVALGASAAFMMPAGTPPSAICFSSGYFSIAQMAKAGLLLNLIGISLIAAVIYLIAPRALGV